MIHISIIICKVDCGSGQKSLVGVIRRVSSVSCECSGFFGAAGGFGSVFSAPPSPPCQPALLVGFMTRMGRSCPCCPGFGGGGTCVVGIAVINSEDAERRDCMLALGRHQLPCLLSG